MSVFGDSAGGHCKEELMAMGSKLRRGKECGMGVGVVWLQNMILTCAVHILFYRLMLVVPCG